MFSSNVSESDPTLIYNSKEFMVSIVKTLRADTFLCLCLCLYLYFLDISVFCILMSSSKAIAGGVAGFWGCVLGLGSLYIVIVMFRRSPNSINTSSEDNREENI